MKIIVDAMGGDNAPQAPVMGAVEANREYGVGVILVGRGETILKVLEDNGIKELPAGVEIAHASEVVEMCDNPATAFREKKDSSLTVGLNLLKSGEGDAFVSAGSTGALLSGATLVVKRIRGIRRAALAPVVPTGNGGAVLIDCGANAECPPEYLLQFAYMGSYYAEHVLGRPEPRVGLLNIGVEPSKGTSLQTAVYPMLVEAGKAGRINFVGNVEAREAVEGADRRVCERRPGIYSPDHIEAMQDILHDEETLNDLAGAHTRLPAFVRRRYGDQILTPQETIQFSTLFGHIIDSCSPFTATHSTGVAHMAVALGRLTGMGQDDLDTLFVAGMLHDIGKLGIPLALLEKPGQLTDEEFPKVKRHADLSRLWLDAVPGFERVSVWGGGHHERLDGKGYPLGLKGEEIPLPSRIMAIADVFTALTEDRPYRKGMTPPEALRIVKGMVKQGHLDGDLSRLLCDHADELDAVRASSQAEARRGFQALHDACAEPDERLRD